MAFIGWMIRRRWRLEGSGAKDRGLIELFAECDSVELWMESEPNAQLILLRLLDYCWREKSAVPKLVMRQLDISVGGADAERLAALNPPTVKPTKDHLDLTGRAWRAYRAPTPQDWFDLLKADLGLLPQLGQCVADLLDELPSVAIGLGATETRMLELIAPGDVHPFDVFPGEQKRNERRVSTTGKSERCSMASCDVRSRRYRGSTRGRLRSTCTTILSVTRDTSSPVCRSPILGRRCWQEKTISSVITRSTDGGVGLS